MAGDQACVMHCYTALTAVVGQVHHLCGVVVSASSPPVGALAPRRHVGRGEGLGAGAAVEVVVHVDVEVGVSH